MQESVSKFILKKLGTFCDPVDNSIKCVYENKNGNIIEMTLLQNKQERDVLCVPTHYFCTMGCKMCHLTNFNSDKKMLRILTDEFNEALVRTVCVEVDDRLVKRTYKKDVLISFMGVGEPLMNVELIDEVFSTDILKKYNLYNEVSYALATMFPSVKNFEKLFSLVREKNIPLKVHYSMHFPDDEHRQELIPASKVSIDEIMDCLNEYWCYFHNNEIGNFEKFHKHGAVELHYTLIDEVNDLNWCFRNIALILNKYPFIIKFINFNEVGDLKKSVKTDEFISDMKVYLGNDRVKFYCPPGKNVGASCGEFTRHYFINTETEEEKQAFSNWKEQFEVKEKVIEFNNE